MVRLDTPCGASSDSRLSQTPRERPRRRARLRQRAKPVINDASVVQAATTLLRVQERRAHLLGLDVPAKHRVNVTTEEAVDAEIKRLGQELGLNALSVEAGRSSAGL